MHLQNYYWRAIPITCVSVLEFVIQLALLFVGANNATYRTNLQNEKTQASLDIVRPT